MEMTAKSIEADDKPRIATQKIILGIGIASIVMLFAGLTSGYIVRQAEGRWLISNCRWPFMHPQSSFY